MAAKEDTPNATQSQVEEMETNEDELKEASDDSSEEEEDENHSEEIQKLRLQVFQNFVCETHVLGRACACVPVHHLFQSINQKFSL